MKKAIQNLVNLVKIKATLKLLALMGALFFVSCSDDMDGLNVSKDNEIHEAAPSGGGDGQNPDQKSGG